MSETDEPAGPRVAQSPPEKGRRAAQIVALTGVGIPSSRPRRVTVPQIQSISSGLPCSRSNQERGARVGGRALQERGPALAEPNGVDARALGHGDGLVHRRVVEPSQLRILADRADRLPGQGAGAGPGHQQDELLPQHALDPVAVGRLQASLPGGGVEGIETWRAGAVELAEADVMVARDVADHSRLDDVGGGVCGPAYGVGLPDDGAEAPWRVDPVQERDDRGVGAEQRRTLPGRVLQIVVLGGEQHDVDRAHVAWRIRRQGGADVQIAGVGAQHRYPVRADGGQVRATGDQRDLLTGGGEAGAVVGSDAPGTHDRDSHHRLPEARLARPGQDRDARRRSAVGADKRRPASLPGLLIGW